MQHVSRANCIFLGHVIFAERKCLHCRYKMEEEQISMTIRSKEHAIRDAKYNEEIARRQAEANLRYGNSEDVMVPPDSIDIPSAQKEIARLQVSLSQ